MATAERDVTPRSISSTQRTRPGKQVRVHVVTLDEGRARPHRDAVATEEPLEIRVQAGDERRVVAITMRTPGADFELAAGFLFAEGVIRGRDDVRRITYCTDADTEQRYNAVNVALVRDTLPDLAPLERHFLTTSACGVCGSASIEAVRRRGFPPLPPTPTLTPDTLYALPERLRAAQGVFDATGGLHAAGLFAADGTLLAVREDVGRHNALDKLIGWATLRGDVPLGECAVLVSGRTSFELVQKCLVAGVPLLAAVGAPSSLAVDLAQEGGLTLVGFLRGRRCNIYAGAGRISIDQ